MCLPCYAGDTKTKQQNSQTLIKTKVFSHTLITINRWRCSVHPGHFTRTLFKPKSTSLPPMTRILYRGDNGYGPNVTANGAQANRKRSERKTALGNRLIAVLSLRSLWSLRSYRSSVKRNIPLRLTRNTSVILLMRKFPVFFVCFRVCAKPVLVYFTAGLTVFWVVLV